MTGETSRREWGRPGLETEAVTNIGSGVPDALYEQTRQHFSEKELVDLTWAVIAINGWNRAAISFRSVQGSYKPAGQGTA